MKKAVIAGMGIQGAAIAYGLQKLGYEVLGIDISEENLRNASDILSRFGYTFTRLHGDALKLFDKIVEYAPDVFISALPFHLNYDLAEKCIENGIRYCDLGGNVGTAENIRTSASKHGSDKPVMTDQGLAPGIANIIADIGYRSIGSADSVKIRVGGLPVDPKGTLKYGLTFNPQGLYNEYIDTCFVLRDGEKTTVEPLGDVEIINFDGLGDMEAFNTSGGIADLLDTMQAKGVKECDYKTIRFPGHVGLIRFMLFECKMDLVTFSNTVINACGFINNDQVLIYIDVSDAGSGKSWRLKSIVKHDETFTAMQKTTGFGAAAVAAILGDGVMDGKPVAGYADVPTVEFVWNMRELLPELEIVVH